MSNVEQFPLKITGKETPSRILDAAKNWGASDVIVCGVVDGEMCVSGTCNMSHEIIGLLELAKHHILIMECEDE